MLSPYSRKLSLSKIKVAALKNMNSIKAGGTDERTDTTNNTDSLTYWYCDDNNKFIV